MRWKDTLNADMIASNLRPRDALNRDEWREIIRKADPAIAGQRLKEKDEEVYHKSGMFTRNFFFTYTRIWVMEIGLPPTLIFLHT